MKLPITGPAYEHVHLDINAQRCVNMYPAGGGPEGKNDLVLLPTSGLKEILDTTKDEIRGMLVHLNVIYVVASDTLFRLSLSSSGSTPVLNSTTLGTLSTTTGRVSMAGNPTQVMIVDGPNGYIYDIDAATLTAITDADFTGSSKVIFMDSFFIYLDPNSGRMFATGINDGTTINALDVATAEGKPDDLVSLAVDKRELWAFGKETVEIWYNAGNSIGFPFTRREGAFIDIGCGAAESVVAIDNTLMWLDNRGYVVLTEGYSPRVVSTLAINQEILSYGDVTDAYAYQIIDKGYLMYVITFPSAEKTWVFDLSTGLWHERAFFNTTTDTFEQDLGVVSATLNNFWFIGDRKSGKIYHLDKDHFKHGSSLIHRIRTYQHFNVERMFFSVGNLELLMSTGNALVSGTGSDPQVILRYSNDGSATWSDELSRSMGKTGEFYKSIRWNRLGNARDWLFEFRISDPINFSIISSVDLPDK